MRVWRGRGLFEEENSYDSEESPQARAPAQITKVFDFDE